MWSSHHPLIPFPSVPLQCLLQQKLLPLLNCQPHQWNQEEQIKLHPTEATKKCQVDYEKEKETNNGAIRWRRWGG